MTHAAGTYLRLDPTEYVLVRTYADGSGILGTYGPFPSTDAANAAIVTLNDAGITDGAFHVHPLYEVEMNERPTALQEAGACGAVWEATADQHCARHSCVLDPDHGAPTVPHRCPCGVTARAAVAPTLMALADSIASQYRDRVAEKRQPEATS